MITRRVWVIEELEVDGKIAQRQSVQTYHDDGQDWMWDRPDERLNETQKAEWDRVMSALSNVNGEDFRHVVCASGLFDHCSGT